MFEAMILLTGINRTDTNTPDKNAIPNSRYSKYKTITN